MKTPETRHLVDAALRVESPAAGGAAAGPPKIVGYAVVYGALSLPMVDRTTGVRFRERFRAGAFARAADSADVRALVNHDQALILGRTTSGTLRLAEDEHGLRVEIDPPDTQAGRDTAESLRRGDLSGMSLRFYYLEDAWDTSGEVAVREVIEADLDEISICAFPAYPDTSAALRSLESHRRGQPRRTPARDRARRRLRLAEADSRPAPSPRPHPRGQR
jgi:HK97 family phage prohead protease